MFNKMVTPTGSSGDSGGDGRLFAKKPDCYYGQDEIFDCGFTPKEIRLVGKYGNGKYGTSELWGGLYDPSNGDKVRIDINPNGTIYSVIKRASNETPTISISGSTITVRGDAPATYNNYYDMEVYG